MIPSALLLATAQTIPWNLSVGITMTLANLVAFVIGYFAIQNTGAGPALPLPQLASKKSFGLPELLATMSFGHILGAGLVLGLSNAGVCWWGQGVGCGVWGFTDFEVVSYLIFREKVPEFYPRSLQWLALFEVKKVQKSYPTRFLDLFSRP